MLRVLNHSSFLRLGECPLERNPASALSPLRQPGPGISAARIPNCLHHVLTCGALRFLFASNTSPFLCSWFTKDQLTGFPSYTCRQGSALSLSLRSICRWTVSLCLGLQTLAHHLLKRCSPPSDEMCPPSSPLQSLYTWLKPHQGQWLWLRGLNFHTFPCILKLRWLFKTC